MKPVKYNHQPYILLNDGSNGDGAVVLFAGTLEECEKAHSFYYSNRESVLLEQRTHALHLGDNSLTPEFEAYAVKQEKELLKQRFYAGILEDERSVIFGSEGAFTEIYESSEGGWMVNVFEELGESLWNSDLTECEDNVYILIDGGLCTGSALDAVQFMTVSE